MGLPWMTGIWKASEGGVPEPIWSGLSRVAAGTDLRIIRGDGWVVGVEPDGVDLLENNRVLCLVGGRIADQRYSDHPQGISAAIAAAYFRDGKESLKQINGRYWLLLWDKTDRHLVVISDVLASLPQIFWACPLGQLVFSTHARAVLDVLGDSPALREEAVAQFLDIGTVLPPLSMYEEVDTLLPGHMLEWDAGGVRVTAGYKFQLDAHRFFSAEEMRQAIGSTVSQALSAHDKVGLLVSGGLDSSVVAAIAVRTGPPERLCALSMGFEESEHDETWAARAMAEHLGLSHDVMYPDAGRWLEHLEALIPHLPHPISDASIVVSHMIAQQAQSRVPAVIAADGPDHFLGRHVTSARMYELSRTIAGIGMAARTAQRLGMGHLASTVLRKRKHAKALEILSSSSVSEVYRCIRRDITWRGLAAPLTLFTPSLRDRMHGNCWPKGLGEGIASLFASPSEADQLIGWDVIVDGVRGIFLKTATATASCSLELYEPFLLPTPAGLLLETSSHLKSVASASGTVRTEYKVALRDMARELLPTSILAKPKHGFSLPIGNWLCERWAGVSASSVMSFLPDQRWLCWDGVEREWRRHMEARTDCSTFLFMLLVLDLWCRCNATGETQL